VVIADDSRLYRELLLVVLGDVQHLEVVGAAADGREAVRLAVENEADIALLDVEMPCLDGFAAAQAIRRERPQTELLLHTSAMLDERRRLGADLDLRVGDKLHLDETLDLVAQSARRRAG
jgi:DNA-binding NarL/FixJ family response regulator